jgi:hypothetical protein
MALFGKYPYSTDDVVGKAISCRCAEMLKVILKERN